MPGQPVPRHIKFIFTLGLETEKFWQNSGMLLFLNHEPKFVSGADRPGDFYHK